MTVAHLRALGTVEYEDALRLQEQLVALRQADSIPDQLLIVQHPHVYTLGRRADQTHVLVSPALRKSLGIQLYESVRGGDVTYHGPGQIVFYPILQLPLHRQDVVRYVRDLEEVMIRALAQLGIQAGRLSGLSGAWVGPDKIGAIGVRMARWVTSHGFALNISTDLRYFSWIVPCGIRDHGVTSLEKLLGRTPIWQDVQQSLVVQMKDIFGLEFVSQPIQGRSIQAFVFRRSPQLEVLCLHRVPEKGAFWQPVTGMIEAGETPAQAAAREVLEETGLSGTLTDLDFVHTFMLDPMQFLAPRFPAPFFVQEHSYALEVTAENGFTLELESHDEAVWLRPEQALDRLRWPGNRLGLEKLLRIL